MLEKLLTEQANPASAGIDTLPAEAALRIINAEDRKVATAVEKEIPAIARAVDAIVAALEKGGRLFYIGAGTSGRLGVLDASEIPPTFSAPPEMVQGIMAGGEAALSRATETTEDDPAIGVRDLLARGFHAGDILVGLAASGRTPYVLGAVAEARRIGAVTIGISCSPASELTRAVEIAIAPLVGPEIIAGSTRMKAGTAQKLVLNMISTATFIRLGYVYGNLMVNVQPKNHKLRGARAPHHRAGGGRALRTRRRTAGGLRGQGAGRDRDGARRRRPRRGRAAPGCLWRTNCTSHRELKQHLMDKFVITGGPALQGEIAVNGSKNSALPALAAALLTAEPVTLHRVPRVRDIRTMERLLVDIGAAVEVEGQSVRLRTERIVCPEAPYELVKTMRASSLVLGPLVARTGRARVSLPGGCAIGARPINLHIFGLEQLGARIHQSHGYIEAEAADGLRGAVVHFDRITVTGTEDLMMAAVLAKGETILRNAAREPEVVDLANLLIKMGAKIEGAGTSTIRVQGVEQVGGAEHTIIPDRIEAGTFLVAGAITDGDLTVTGCVPDHVNALVSKLQQAGAEVTQPDASSLRVRGRGRLRSVDMTTEEYPGFATDLQAQYMALMTQAEGIAIVIETIFENRFMHAQELARMGANIRIDGKQAIVAGPRALSGAGVIASDLRASASLVLGALVARGDTVIDRVYHIDRGYERIEAKLAAAGAKIRRVE